MFLLIKFTLLYAVVLMLVAMGGMFSERSGVINIALEGIMAIGGLAGVFVLVLFPDLPAPALVALSILASAVSGMIYSLLLGFSAITLKADQTIGGTALNMLATAIAIVLVKAFNNGSDVGNGAASAKLNYTNAAFIYKIGPFTVNIFLFIGIILSMMGRKVEMVHRFFEQFNDIMMKMTSLVMYVAPIGVFCLLARTFANIGFDAFLPMVKYMAGVLLALAVQCLVVYMLLLFLLARVNPVKFLKKFISVMMFAFSTATSNATIPLNIETLEKKMGVDRRISSFTIPLGATINMDGTSIMQGVAVVFTAQLFGVQLGPVEYATVIATATLASIGTAGVPSVGLITLSMVFNSVGLPLEGIALIMGIDRILDMTRTAVNITGDAVCTTVVAKQAGRMNLDVFNDPHAGQELDDVKAA